MRLSRALVAVTTAGAIAATAPIASAATLYASPYRLLKGSTVLPCAPERPCNLAFALQNATAGDDVAMAPGNYRPPTLTILQSQGPYTTPLTVPSGVVLHGTAGAAPSVIHARIVQNASAAVAVSQSATLRDVRVQAEADAAGGVTYGINLAPGALVERVSSRLSSLPGTIGSACVMSAATLRSSECIAAGSGPLTAGVAGVSGQPSVYRVVNVTAIGIGPQAVGLRIGVSNQASTMVATNVIARGDGVDVRAGAGLAGGNATLVIDHSNWRTQEASAPMGAVAQIVPGTGNQSGSAAAGALFVDATAGDYRQAAGSSTIDAGISDPASGPLAIAGTPRTIGACTDMGADEFVPPSLAPTTPTGGPAAPPGGATPSADATAPVLSQLRIGRSWRLSRGTRVRVTLSEAASVTLTVARRLPGRRVGPACRALTRVNRARGACVRFVTQGRLVVTAPAGTTSIPFRGRLSNGRRLTAGVHRVRAVPVDTAGNRGAARSALFRTRR